MTKEELKAHCEKQVRACEMVWAHCQGERPHGKVYEEHKLILELLEQEPILDKVKQAKKEIENEVKFWSEPSKYNVESVVNARKAKVQSYKHCLEIIDKLIAESEGKE